MKFCETVTVMWHNSKYICCSCQCNVAPSRFLDFHTAFHVYLLRSLLELESDVMLSKFNKKIIFLIIGHGKVLIFCTWKCAGNPGWLSKCLLMRWRWRNYWSRTQLWAQCSTWTVYSVDTLELTCCSASQKAIFATYFNWMSKYSHWQCEREVSCECVTLIEKRSDQQ